MTSENPPETTQQPEPRPASAIVEEFIGHLRSGNIDDAAALWTGYPELSTDPTSRAAAVGSLITDHDWLAQPQSYDLLEAPAADGVNSVVTVVSDMQPSQQRLAVAFVVGEAQIQRLPQRTTSTVSPLPGSAVSPGDLVVLSGVPTEGGAVGYVNGTAVPLEVDHDNLTSSIHISSSVGSEAVVTFSSATPELPTADAFWYSVR
ncbi:MAG: hypothetical protein ACRD2C_09440 [Acidimicrobiales bacterium]